MARVRGHRPAVELVERHQHLGPRAVRNVSAIGRRVHNHFGIDPWEMARVHDLGDVPLSEGNNNERSIEMITDYYERLDAAGCRPAIGIGPAATTATTPGYSILQG